LKFSPDSNLEIPDTTLFQELDGECVLLNLANESYYGLDEIGTRMWNVLSESDSIADAMAVLTKEYDIDEKTLRTDLDQFINELLENKLVQVSA
jgi:hypothetical protein